MKPVMILSMRTMVMMMLTLITACQSTSDHAGSFFREAQAIWPVRQQSEKNLTVGFRAQFSKPDNKSTVLRIAGSSLYRIFLNGEFIGHGPARAGHDHYRVDEWELQDKLTSGRNVLAIEVAGYNVNSYYLLDQPSFVQAEVVSGDKVLAATSVDDDFEAFHLTGRIQKVPRYSFQRPFIEYYRIEPGYDEWRINEGKQKKELTCELVELKKLVPRRIGYPDFAIRRPVKSPFSGEMKTGIMREHYWKDRAVLNIGDKLGGFPEAELELNPAIELQEMERINPKSGSSDNSEPVNDQLVDKQYRIYDFGTNLTGFIGAEVEVTAPGRFFFTFDEILTDEDVDFKRLGCINAVTYDLSPGVYSMESFEPYTLRYLKLIVIDGACSIKNIYLREYVNPDISVADFESSDARLNRIYRAGVETFRQNAVDIFMDCPSRERAGWLCDSYFTARVAYDVSGNTLLEKNFFENFLLPDTFEFLPEGMLPMCYPADHNDGVFIPNWAMWFVLQLNEYLYRSNDREMIDALQPRVMKLLEYFQAFKNEDGLLESLDSWVFVEWSAANRFVQDVNYPTNMLYAATLEAAGNLYGLGDLKKEAAAIRETIQKQSFNGTFFVDNAIRNDQNQLQVTDNTTEVCQYYAFYFNTATPESHPELWKTLTEQFGPGRKEHNLWPSVYPANSFVGNYLRLELLSRNNLRSQLLAESIDYFDYMAARTGTLWENISSNASCDHGFASHVAHVLYRDVLGIADVDQIRKEITLEFSELDLDYCKGQIPIGEKVFRVEWEHYENSIYYHFECPQGYEVVIRNKANLTLVER